MAQPFTTVIHWFRKDLRVHDNPALRNAINEAENHNHCLQPIYILDPAIRSNQKIGVNRLRFLIQSLENLNQNLKKINLQLFVFRGKPEYILNKLFNVWQVRCLTYEKDTEPNIVEQDERIEELASKSNVYIIQRISHTIYDIHDLINKNNGQVPITYQKFLHLIKDISVKPVVKISKEVSEQCKLPKMEDHNLGFHNVPTLQELGIDGTALCDCVYQGGESEALQRLDHFISNREWVSKFEKPNTAPNSLEPSTTVLSPYISIGCLSSRLFYHKLKDLERSLSLTQPPVSLLGQLLWREFYYTAAAGTPNFDKMIGNPICTQIPWRKNESLLQAWADGKTGYPFVDAIMRQLKQEGWIHHLARHMVACFLTRGDLWISWEEGQKVFEEYLLDYDWSLNTGNWLWLSASAFFYKYYRIYSPVAFGKKTDKEGMYIRKYVPELKKYPAEYIYEPWKAPMNVQKAANCIVEVDYPKRIVEHEIVHKENITKMSLAYKSKRENKTLKRIHRS